MLSECLLEPEQLLPSGIPGKQCGAVPCEGGILATALLMGGLGLMELG